MPSILITLNLLAFLLHTVWWLSEPLAQAIRKELGNLQTLWTDVRTLIRLFYCPNWSALFTFISAKLDLSTSSPN